MTYNVLIKDVTIDFLHVIDNIPTGYVFLRHRKAREIYNEVEVLVANYCIMFGDCYPEITFKNGRIWMRFDVSVLHFGLYMGEEIADFLTEILYHDLVAFDDKYKNKKDNIRRNVARSLSAGWLM